MKYVSTRGKSEALGFNDVVISGLAPDGGLYCPESLPKFSIEEIRSWKNLSYSDLAFNIIKPFVGGEISDSDLKRIITEVTKNFTTSNVIKIHDLENDLHVMELFHGPTLAFKDVALQFLGQLQDHILTKRNQDIVIVGATSGDTGSAAIEGVKNCKHITLFMMHPDDRISTIQRHQMTTVLNKNIHNIAVRTNFDDCQAMVKDIFQSQEFLKGKKLSAVNSINWARIVAQIVYYFKSVLELTGANEPVSFTVPSGNLGDVFGGYLAKCMGLPIDELIVSTNSNDILHRFFNNNDYSKSVVTPTVAPSMDIQVSSNFERLLYLEHGSDGKIINDKMEEFRKIGKLKVNDDIHKKISATFKSAASDDSDIKKEIKRVYEKYKYIVCPHTATGTKAAEKFRKAGRKMVVLATAHPAKFPEVVMESIGVNPELPPHLKDLLSRPEKYLKAPNDIDLIKNYIYQNSL